MARWNPAKKFPDGKTVPQRLASSLAGTPNLTEEALGDLLSCSQSTINRVKNGNQASLEDWQLAAWARHTGSSVEWLLTGNEPAAPRSVGRSEAGTSDPLTVSFPAARSRLELTTKPPLPPEGRQNLFLRKPTWELVCRDAYAKRDEILKDQVKRFEDFFARRRIAVDQLRLPVFWIGGRSGDGKSVLLLQLIREILENNLSRIVFWYNSPDDLIKGLAQPPNVPSEPLILAVDDLHKVLDWDVIAIAIERAASGQRDLVVLTCGPSPERTAFLRDKQNLVALLPSDTPNLAEADAASLTKHLGVEVHASNEKRPTLVEQLFFSLGGEQDLTAFAKSLQDRVDLPAGQKGLLSELTALTWMDVPFPVGLLDPTAQSRIEELSDETQLHFEEVPGGYRFGHPAIAKKMFDALTMNHVANTPLVARLAGILSPVLRRMETADRRRSLRQIGPRLAKDVDLTPLDVLSLLYRTAGGPTLAGDIAICVLQQQSLRDKGIAEQTKWTHSARTFRDHVSVEKQLRAELASSLALREPADDHDLRTAFKLTASPDVGPYLGRMIAELLSRRRRGTAFRVLPRAIDWAERNPHAVHHHAVVESLLAAYPNDARVRRVVRELVGNSDVAKLRPSMIGLLAKFLEEESESLVKRWLSMHHRSLQAGSVLTTLLSRPGSVWIEPAIEWVGSKAQPDSSWAAVVGRILQKVEPNNEIVPRAKAWALELEDSEGANKLFEVLAERADDLGAFDVLEKRLVARWGKQDALLIFGRLWTHKTKIDEITRDRLHDVGKWAESPSKSQNAGQVGGTTDLRDEAAQTLAEIATTSAHPEYWVPLCLECLRKRPTSNSAGAIVNRLLSTLTALRHGEIKGVTSELVEAEDFLVSTAWTIVDNIQLHRSGHHSALAGLIRSRWDVERKRIRDAILGYYFYPNIHYSSPYILGVWLSHVGSRSEALEFLLDNSIDEEKRLRARATAAARNLHVVFEALNAPHVSESDQRELCRLLEYGVGDSKGRTIPAWEAWIRYNEWPDVAISYIWRGILRSSLEGFTMRRDLYWHEFERWFSVSKDPHCAAILERAS